MSKLAIIKINQGDFQVGFSATVRIEEEGGCIYDRSHRLPPAPDLPELYQSWKSEYSDRQLRGSRNGSPKASGEKSEFRALEIIEKEPTNILIGDLAEELEKGLNGWLSSLDRGVLEFREGLLDNLSKTEDIRFVIETKNETLSRLPWERWDLLERYENSDVILSFAGRPMSRPPVKLKEKVKKILVILGESSDINVQADLKLLQDRLPPDAEILEPLIATCREKIDRALWDEKFDILFFAGHGSTDFDNGEGKFYINETESLSVADLKEGLKQAIANGLKLAIFNSCDGIGLARDLTDLQMEAIVVMRENTPDEVAQRFLEFFLKAFAIEGKTLPAAVTEARKRLIGLESRYPCASWLPVLCQHPEAEMSSWESFSSLPDEVKKKRLNRNLPAKLHWGVSLLSLVFLTLPLSLPKLAVVANNYGFKSYQKGDLSKARAALNLATKLDPNNSVAPYNLGWICEQLQDFDCAEKKYKISGELNLYAAYSQLGSLYIKQKKYTTSTRLIKKKLDIDSSLPNFFEGEEDESTKYALHKNLGLLLLKQGSYEEALFQTLNILHKNIGLVLLKQGSDDEALSQLYKEALSHLEEAIKLDGDRAPARCLRAQVLDRLGDDKAAVKEWEMCLKTAKAENPDEAIWLGMALQRLQTVDRPRGNGNEKSVRQCKAKGGEYLCPS